MMVALSWLSSPGGSRGGHLGLTSMGATGNGACSGGVASHGGVSDRGGDTVYFTPLGILWESTWSPPIAMESC
jgi:hypothetical protein